MLLKSNIHQSWIWKICPIPQKRKKKLQTCLLSQIRIITVNGPIANIKNGCHLRSVVGTQFCTLPNHTGAYMSEDMKVVMTIEVTACSSCSSYFSDSYVKYITVLINFQS